MKRILWVDNVKVIACILIVLGHFLQSMVKAGILPDTGLYQWFTTTIYYFHVPLFFICSGYLYQKRCRISDFNSWRKNVERKALTLGVPYFVFSIATWSLKICFSGEINNKVTTGLMETLFLNPLSPYWYLYSLFFIFVLTPTFSTKAGSWLGLLAALLGKFFISSKACGIYAISTVLSNEIWFVLGMCVCVFEVPMAGKRMSALAATSGGLFVISSVVVFLKGIHNGVISFLLGVMACLFVVLTAALNEERLGKTKLFSFFTQYTMPVFLMHTLFAAPVRVLLLKLGVANAAIHVAAGLVIGFVGPIAAAIVMRKLKYPEFILYPGKFIRTL